jgi:hypothetical protein
MPDDIFSQLFDFGALGLFAGFLIWQHLGMQKRLDLMVQKFQEQLREIESKHEERVEIMRGRYDVVIDKVRAEGAEQLRECLTTRDELITKLGDQVEENARAVGQALIKQDVALSKLDEGLTEMRLQREVRRLKDDR